MAERENTRRTKLVEYLRSNLAKGYSADSLKWALIRQGNSRVDVEYAIEQVKGEISKKIAEQEKPKIAQESYEDVVVVEEKPWWKFW